MPRLRAVLEHGGNIDAVAFRPDGRLMLTGSDDGPPGSGTRRPAGRSARRWRTAAWCSVHAFAADGRRVLTGGFGGRVRTWDPQTGRPDGPELAAPGEVAVHLTVFDGGRRILTLRPDGRGADLGGPDRPADRATRRSAGFSTARRSSPTAGGC